MREGTAWKGGKKGKRKSYVGALPEDVDKVKVKKEVTREKKRGKKSQTGKKGRKKSHTQEHCHRMSGKG